VHQSAQLAAAQQQLQAATQGGNSLSSVVQAQQQHAQQLQQLQLFWQAQVQEIEQMETFRSHQLPLARIKKIMRSDEDVRMISQEAPVLFAKACELFILELTLRSWIHTEENKRKTLQRNDIAMAITKTDIFDFLIDIVPRDDIKSPTKKIGDEPLAQRPYIPPELQSYYFQLAQQQNALQQNIVDPMILYQQQQIQSFQFLQRQAQIMQHMQLQQQGQMQGSDHDPHENERQY